MIQCENLVKIYKVADLEVVALQGLDLTVDEGEMMAIIGNSGSGKSTLLNMLGGLERPSAGKLLVNGQDLLRLTDQELVKYKRDTVGFVWQNNARNLVPYLSAVQNVELPMLLKGNASKARARELLDMVGLGHRLHNRLSELSGGEQQRVAIAIAIANEPKVLLADEPTGNVDSATSDRVLDVFRELNRALGITVVIVTHDLALAKKVDRIMAIRDGKAASEIIRRPSKSAIQDLVAQIGKVEFDSSSSEFDSSSMDEFHPADADVVAAVEAPEEDTHIELAVVDSAGRLQLPAEYLEAIGAEGTNRLRVELADSAILISRPD